MMGLLFWNFVSILISLTPSVSKLFGTTTLTQELIIHLIEIKRLARNSEPKILLLLLVLNFAALF